MNTDPKQISDAKLECNSEWYRKLCARIEDLIEELRRKVQ